MTTRLARALASLVESGQLLAKLADDGAGGRMSSVTMRAVAALSTEGAMSVSALARRCHVTQPTMSAIVQHAEREGWMRRRGSGRTTRIEATRAGIATRDSQREATGAVLEPRFARLGARERATIERAAMVITATLERDRPQR